MGKLSYSGATAEYIARNMDVTHMDTEVYTMLGYVAFWYVFRCILFVSHSN